MVMPHICDMLKTIFCEQQSVVKKFGFFEMPLRKYYQ